MMMIIVVFFHEKEASGHFNATSEIQTSSTHLSAGQTTRKTHWKINERGIDNQQRVSVIAE